MRNGCQVIHFSEAQILDVRIGVRMFVRLMAEEALLYGAQTVILVIPNVVLRNVAGVLKDTRKHLGLRCRQRLRELYAAEDATGFRMEFE